MTITQEEIIAWRERTDQLRATPVGAAFFKFKMKIERAARMDAEDSFSDNDRKSTRQALEEANSAEREFRALLEPLAHDITKRCLESAEADVERLQAERAGDQQRLFHYEGEMEQLRKQCEGLAQSAMNNGQDLLLKEHANERLTAAIAYVRQRSQRACEILNEFDNTTQHLGVDDKGREWVRFLTETVPASYHLHEITKLEAENERLRATGLELLAVIDRLGPLPQHSLARAQIDKARAALRDRTVARVDEHGVAYNAAGESIGITGTTGDSCNAPYPASFIGPVGPIHHVSGTGDMADPTCEMYASPEFEAVWQCIKSWDISVPDAYVGYCGATGNHVRAILDALGDKTTDMRAEIARLTAGNERLKTTNESLEREMKIVRGAIGDPKDRAEITQLKADKAEMADAILQIGGLSEMHFRTLVSFELAEFVFTERLAVLRSKC